jgi:hypothetical protein
VAALIALLALLAALFTSSVPYPNAATVGRKIAKSAVDSNVIPKSALTLFVELFHTNGAIRNDARVTMDIAIACVFPRNHSSSASREDIFTGFFIMQRHRTLLSAACVVIMKKSAACASSYVRISRAFSLNRLSDSRVS